jgi:putative oxidoreductase
MGLGSTTSLVLIIIAEFFCSIFLILGLFTRFACIPIIIAMSVVVFSVTHGHIFSDGEKATLFLIATITILFCGPGRISVDGMIKK